MKVNTTDLTAPQLVEIFNAFSDKPVKKFASKSSGAKRIQFLCNEEVPKDMDQATLDLFIKDLPEDLKERITLKGKSKKAAGGSGNGAGRKSNYDGKTLTPIVPFNPFNVNGRRFKAFELITVSGCKTRQEFIDAGGTGGDLSSMVNTGYIAPLDEKELAEFEDGKLTAKKLRKRFYKEMNLRTPLEKIEESVKLFEKSQSAEAE